MKKLIVAISFAFASFAIFAQGADGQSPSQAAPAETKAVVAKPSPKETATAEVSAAATNGVAAAKEPATKRVLLKFIDGNPVDNPTTCKRYLQTFVEGELANAGVTVVPSEPADVAITGTLRGGKLNSRGRTVVWQVTADMHAMRLDAAATEKVVAKQRFDVKSGDARVASEAQKRCADRLGPDVVKFALDAIGKASGGVKGVLP